MDFLQSKDKLLYKKVLKGNQDGVKDLRRAGAGLEWTDNKGRTPLILACTRGDLRDMAITLIDLGADIHSYKPGVNEGTPLHYAAIKGLDQTVKLLLSRGANPLAINDDCQTPLYMARARNHVTVVRIIEDKISLFCGMLRELCGFELLEELGLHFQSRKMFLDHGQLFHYQKFTLKNPSLVCQILYWYYLTGAQGVDTSFFLCLKVTNHNCMIYMMPAKGSRYLRMVRLQMKQDPAEATLLKL